MALSIGKITIDGNENYGNKLQSYALQQYLRSFADRVDALWHIDAIKDLPLHKRWGFKQTKEALLNRNHFRKRYEDNAAGRDLVRAFRIQQFDKQYMQTRYDCRNILKSQVGEEYDYFVVGSDQVWNPVFLNEADTYFLRFAPPEKRIAFSASFGVSQLPGAMKKKIAPYLREFRAISVREKRAAEMVEEMTGRAVPVLADPTLLLSKKQWAAVERKPEWYRGGGRYILTYFLGPVPDEIEKAIQRRAEKEKLMIIRLLDSRFFEWYISDPAEFLYLISHAAYVYTDSFHGTVFSILNHVPFTISDRIGSLPMTSRIDTLLSLFHLEERRAAAIRHYQILNDGPAIWEIEPILQEERDKASAFLRQAMGV